MGAPLGPQVLRQEGIGKREHQARKDRHPGYGEDHEREVEGGQRAGVPAARPTCFVQGDHQAREAEHREYRRVAGRALEAGVAAPAQQGQGPDAGGVQQHGQHRAEQRRQHDHGGVGRARAGRQHHLGEGKGQRQDREAAEHEAERQLRVQIAEREVEPKHQDQGQNRPVDGAADAIAERVERQAEHDQALAQAPGGVDSRPAPQQLRAERKPGEGNQEHQRRLAPAEPEGEAQERAADDHREHSFEHRELRESVHAAWFRFGQARRQDVDERRSIRGQACGPVPLRDRAGLVEPQAAHPRPGLTSA